MNYSMIKNKVQLIGNLGQTPEVRKLDNGTKMARMSIATNDAYINNAGETVQDTQWHAAVAWGKVADVAEKYLEKGSEVVVEGKLMHRDYIDKEGIKRYVTEVQVHNILLLDKRKDASVF